VGGAIQDKRLLDQISRVTLQPSGKVEGLSSLFGCLSATLGSMLFADTDKTLVVKNAARAITFASAGVFRPPTIQASNRRTLFGPMEFVCIGKNNTAFGAAASRMSDTTGGAAAGVASSDIVTAPWTITGAGLGTDFETVDGVTVEAIPTWEPVQTDSNGVINYALTSVEFRATFAPIIAVAGFLAALNIHFTRGASLNSLGADLTLTNGEIDITLADAAILDPQLALAVNANPIRQVVAVATRTSSATTLGAVAVST
ncbi:MAG: hypothetical protein ACREIA_20025, partial [Opitutaceae bacterium]